MGAAELLKNLAETIKRGEGHSYEQLAAVINMQFIVPLQLALDRDREVARDLSQIAGIIHTQNEQLRKALTNAGIPVQSVLTR